MHSFLLIQLLNMEDTFKKWIEMYGTKQKALMVQKDEKLYQFIYIFRRNICIPKMYVMLYYFQMLQ